MRFNYTLVLAVGLLASGVVLAASSYDSGSSCCGSTYAILGLIGGVTLVALKNRKQ